MTDDARFNPERAWEFGVDAARWNPDAADIPDGPDDWSWLVQDDLGEVSNLTEPVWFIAGEKSQPPHEIVGAQETERPCEAATWEIAGASNEHAPLSKSRDDLVRMVEVQLIMANAKVNWQKIENRLR